MCNAQANLIASALKGKIELPHRKLQSTDEVTWHTRGNFGFPPLPALPALLFDCLALCQNPCLHLFSNASSIASVLPSLHLLSKSIELLATMLSSSCLLVGARVGCRGCAQRPRFQPQAAAGQSGGASQSHKHFCIAYTASPPCSLLRSRSRQAMRDVLTCMHAKSAICVMAGIPKRRTHQSCTAASRDVGTERMRRPDSL